MMTFMLQPQNLFVVKLANGSQCLKIGDFDLSRSLENDKSTVEAAFAGVLHIYLVMLTTSFSLEVLH